MGTNQANSSKKNAKVTLSQQSTTLNTLDYPSSHSFSAHHNKINQNNSVDILSTDVYQNLNKYHISGSISSSNEIKVQDENPFKQAPKLHLYKKGSRRLKTSSSSRQ
jgi:hypothetical protein